MGSHGGTVPLVEGLAMSFSGQFVHYWLPHGTQLSPMAPRSCRVRSNHTPGNDFGRSAEPGEGSRRVSNPRWVGNLIFPACEDCLGISDGGNPCDSTAEKAMQHGTVECIGRARAPRTTRLSTATKEVSGRNDPSCHWTQASEAERVDLSACTGLPTIKPFTQRFLLCSTLHYHPVLRRRGSGEAAGGGDHWEL